MIDKAGWTLTETPDMSNLVSIKEQGAFIASSLGISKKKGIIVAELFSEFMLAAIISGRGVSFGEKLAIVPTVITNKVRRVPKQYYLLRVTPPYKQYRIQCSEPLPEEFYEKPPYHVIRGSSRVVPEEEVVKLGTKHRDKKEVK